jgi:hypothetical protein
MISMTERPAAAGAVIVSPARVVTDIAAMKNPPQRGAELIFNCLAGSVNAP